MNLFDAVELGDLAVVIKFLVQSATPATVDDIIRHLRRALDVEGAAPVPGAAKARSGSAPSTSLILEALRSSLLVDKLVADAWFKTVSAIGAAADHRPADLLLLVILHGAPQRRRKVAALWKKKVASGRFNVALLEHFFRIFGDALVDCARPLQIVAGTLLGSAQTECQAFARATYVGLVRFLDPLLRQDVVAVLISHIGSGSEHEADGAFAVLQTVAADDARLLAPFVVFIKGLLDFLDSLSPSNTRALFVILAAVGLCVRLTFLFVCVSDCC